MGTQATVGAENLPAKILTWEHKAVRRFWPNSTGGEESGRRASLFVSFLWTDKERKCYGGTFAAGAGGFPTVRFTPDQLAGPSSWLGGYENLFRPSMIGKQFVVDAGTANSPTNEGTFTITDVDPDGLWVEFGNNGLPVAEADATVTAHVREGTFTNPWQVVASGAGTTGKGAAHDNRDRWLFTTDLQSSTSGTGAKSWIVYRNANNAEFCQIHWTNNGAYDWERVYWFARMEGAFFSGGTTTAYPDCATRQTVRDNGDSWFGSGTPESDISWFTAAMSDDGKNFFFWIATDNYISNITQSYEVADPITGPLIPWNGNHNAMDMSTSSSATVPTVGNFTDSAQFWVTVDKDAAVIGPVQVNLYCVTEFAGASQAPEIQGAYYDELGHRDTHFWPIALARNGVPARGRYGWLRDIYFNVDRTEKCPLNSGCFLPDDGSRQWVKVGHMLYPWDGTSLWRKN